MKKNSQIVAFVEELTSRNWFLSVLPCLVRAKSQQRVPIFINVFNSSKVMLHVARIMARLLGMEVSKLSFAIEDIRDESGFSLRLKMSYQEMAKIQAEIENEQIFQNFVSGLGSDNRLTNYLSKSLSLYDALGVEGYRYVWNALLLIQVFIWMSERAFKKENQKTFIFLEKRLWWGIIEGYSSGLGAKLIALPRKVGRKVALERAIRSWGQDFIYGILNRSLPHQKRKVSESATMPHVAVDYYGHLNLEKPSLYCDLFFMHQSQMRGSDVKLLFRYRSSPLDKEIYEELQKYGVTPIVLNYLASKVPQVLKHKSFIKAERSRDKMLASSSEEKWLKAEEAKYKRLRSYWLDVFEQHNIKLFMHWYKYDAEHMAIADALQSLGGITAIYQRSFEAQPAPETTIAVDIEFGFSMEHAELERQNNSNILYHVTTGYPGDHRFPLLLNEAQRIRDSLQRQGVKYVMAFFDENTVDDPRWFAGHEFTQKNYAFLLEKVLTNPWFGLVIKPKQPNTLRSRLGPAKKLLDEALATKRCYTFTEGVLQCSSPPALAALAADIAVHEHLSSGTAGLESALCGTPTLLMDFEGWPGNKLYELGIGRVVFTEWDSAWEACRNYFFSNGCVDSLGDWSPILNELDPFRDGRAAERIGTYLKWLLDGFKAGLSREIVMADAAERYCQQWGYDKIVTVCRSQESSGKQELL
jgi:hypothetical protein